MKTKTLIFILFVFFSIDSFAQLKFDGKIDSKFKTFQLDDGSYKYVKYNKKEQVLFIYNIDNSLWREVKMPLPKYHVLDELKHISIHTFNQDNLVELIYSCAVYSPNSNYQDPNEDFFSVNFTLNIINELGESILKVQDSNEMEIIDSNGEKKIIVYKHIGNGYKAKDETLIYSF
ncbi:MAG: hypothetical protein AB7S69_10290 [Salinivirgaceae bacterium]